jgi:tetratricopeptide (TPR) repeat protein
LVLVEKLRRFGAHDAALALCQDLVHEAPEDPDPLHAAATISREAGQAQMALPLLERAVELAPDRADLLCDLAALLQEVGEDAGAEETFAKVLVLDPAFKPAHLALAEIYEAQGRTDDAIWHLDTVVGHEPGALDLRERLARLLDATGDGARALDVKRETMRYAQTALAEAYGRIRSHSLHTPIYETDAERLAWSYALLSYTLAGTDVARSEERRTDTNAAVRSYRRLLGVLATAAEQAREVDGLRRTYESAAQAFAHCHFELASLYEKRGNLAGAVYHLEEAWRARRSPSLEGRAKLGELAPRCAPDIAGIRDQVAAFHGRMPPPATIPITRWDFARHAREWVTVAAQARTRARPPVRRRIAIAAFNPHHMQLFFAIACVLFARGHAVDVLWMPCLEFDRNCEPEPRYDQWDEALLAREIAGFAAAGLPGGLRLLDLRDVPPGPEAPGFAEAAERQAYIDLRNHYRNASLDANAEPMRTRKRNRRLKNLDAMRRFATYLASTPVDRLILFNAGVMEYGAAYHAARGMGVTVVEWEQGPISNAYYLLSINRTHGDLDMRQLWEADAGSEFTTARRRRVAEWFMRHGRADWRGATPRGRYVPDAAGRVVLEDLGLDPGKPTVALFPNITWDTATLDREVAFASVADWVLRATEFFAGHPEWQLVIRTHPVENSVSEEFVGKIVKERWPELPANVRIVEADERLYSYRLIAAAQLGLYYSGTLALEMAMMGVLALTGARPLIGGFGFTREAATPEAYFDMIAAALADPDGNALTPDEIERAWRYADLYIVQALKPLPWSYQRFWSSIRDEWPMARVLGPEGAAPFDRVFAVFAGEIELPDGIVGDLGAPAGTVSGNARSGATR